MFFIICSVFFISVVYLDLFSISNDLADLSLQVECTHYVGNGGDILDSHVPHFTCPVCKENGVESLVILGKICGICGYFVQH